MPSINAKKTTTSTYPGRPGADINLGSVIPVRRHPPRGASPSPWYVALEGCHFRSPLRRHLKSQESVVWLQGKSPKVVLPNLHQELVIYRYKLDSDPV